MAPIASKVQKNLESIPNHYFKWCSGQNLTGQLTWHKAPKQFQPTIAHMSPQRKLFFTTLVTILLPFLLQPDENTLFLLLVFHIGLSIILILTNFILFALYLLNTSKTITDLLDVTCYLLMVACWIYTGLLCLFILILWIYLHLVLIIYFFKALTSKQLPVGRLLKD